MTGGRYSVILLFVSLGLVRVSREFPLPLRISPGACLALIRPVNCVITFASVLVGAGMAGRPPDIARVLTASLSAALIAGGGNALNDACDEHADRINRPSRPIPSGRASRGTALWMAGGLFLAGAGLGLFLGEETIWLAVTAIFGLVAYDASLKRVPVVGNLTVSGISGLALIYGGVAVGQAAAALVPALFAFLFHLGREILKDLEDTEGDTAAGSRSVATVWGARAALAAATAVYFLLVLLTPIPFWKGLYDWPYIALVLCPVDLILLYAVVSMWRNRSRQNLIRLDILLKAGMVFGLLALWAGRREIVPMF